MQAELEITAFDPATATEDDFVALNTIERRMTEELRPEYPQPTIEETIADRQHPPAGTRVLEWHARRPGSSQIVATAGLHMRQPDNQHAASFWISVLPEARRLGIATRLLRVLAEACRRDSRRVLIGWGSSTSAAGEAFMQRLGAEVGQQVSHSQLLLADVDRGLMRSWIDAAAGLQDEFELVLHQGPLPEEDLEATAQALNTMNDEPRDNLDWEEIETTVDDIRQYEASLVANKEERWILNARHRASGHLVGRTGVHYRPAHPDVVSQGYTAVAPAYRNRGIGRWLKAAMMEKVLAERRLATRVHTGNASSNAAMLKINEEMGFRLYRTSINWQVTLDKVYAYLDGVPQGAR